MIKSFKKIACMGLAIITATTLLTGCGAGSVNGENSEINSTNAGEDRVTLGNLVFKSSLDLDYANEFKVDFFEGGYSYIETTEGDKLLVVPQGAEIPKGLPSDVAIYEQPAEKIYLAGTAVMSLFDAIDAVDTIAFSSQEADGWSVESAKEATKRGDMVFAGKYASPDYELLVNKGCTLAIESTMIFHSPEIREKLNELGIPVLVDLSSRESEPLGRMEWVKLYGVLTGKLDEANAFMSEKKAEVDEVATKEPTGKTVAFFSVNSSGLAVVRKSKDYVAKMIEIAGGEYIFKGLGDGTDAFSTVSMSLEEFYNTAVNADVIIYNSSIEAEITSIADLIEKNEIFADFKAVKDNNVWCTTKNMYQSTSAMADIIVDMRAIFSDDAKGQESLQYIYRIQ